MVRIGFAIDSEVATELYHYASGSTAVGDELRGCRRELRELLRDCLDLHELPQRHDARRGTAWLKRADLVHERAKALVNKTALRYSTRGWRDFEALTREVRELGNEIEATRRRNLQHLQRNTRRSHNDRLTRAVLPARQLPATQNGPASPNYYREPIDSK